MAKFTGAVLALAAVVSAASVRAEDAAVDKLYGEGVHAFFAGNLGAAQQHLDASIAAGNRDPRCYYYRGLTLSRLGKADAAKADLQTGAKLEAQSPESTSLVNRSIQRIQGSTRLALEKYRADAQLAAVAARKAREAQRYGTARASAIQELEKQAAAAGASAEVLPENGKKAASAAAAATDPAATAPDPFGDDPAATGPAVTDPAAEKPAEEMPAEEKPAEEAPAGEAPAAEQPATEPPATEPPATEPPAGEAPATEEKPAAETPPASEEKPAAEEPPAGEAPAAEPPAAGEAPAGEAPAGEAPPDDLFGEAPAKP